MLRAIMPNARHVLVVDDGPAILEMLERNLERHGYVVHTAATGTDALTIIRDGFNGVVLLDLNLPDYRALELFTELRKLNDLIPVIIITAHGTIDVAIEAIRLGAFDFLAKTDAFLERVFVATKNAFNQMELQSRLRELSNELKTKYNFDQIVSQSEQMKPVFELMRHAVDSRVTVLVQGESGTGKELIARALHYSGSRAQGPFVPVNCAGIPETLLESELFGYEKGAFTGATARKRGKFELAHHGTLFLDEIGEMPMLLQTKLLRALQERSIERLGGNELVELDVRFVCATNRDLRAEVKAGRFREDLFYRLAVFPITVPPLRDRRGDITVLATHFLQKLAREEKKQLDGFDVEALQALIEYDYPGNVRELQNIVAHAVVVAGGPKLRLRDLPHMLRPEGPTQAERAAIVRQARSLSDAFDDVVDAREKIPTMEALEELAIERAVELCEGSLVDAAKALGISRATIYRRVGKLASPARERASA